MHSSATVIDQDDPLNDPSLLTAHTKGISGAPPPPPQLNMQRVQQLTVKHAHLAHLAHLAHKGTGADTQTGFIYVPLRTHP